MPGLSFLCKKGWHTSTIKNAERVWLAEQARERETKKMEDLKRQLMEERQVEEMRTLQRSKGFTTQKHLERLDWMYEGPGAAEAQEKNDEYLLGKKYKGASEVSDADRLKQSAASGSARASGAGPAPSASELRSRVHEDPMLMIRMQEEEAKQRVLSNPVRMRELQEAAAAKRSKHADKKQAKKQAKKAKKQVKKQLKKAKKLLKKAQKRAEAGQEATLAAPALPSVPAASAASAAPAASAPAAARRSRWGSSSGGSSGGVAAKPQQRERERDGSTNQRRAERPCRVAAAKQRPAKRQKLTPEERAARLAAMSSDAQSHNVTKKAHLANLTSTAKAAELEEASAMARGSGGQSVGSSESFRRKMERDAFNAGGSMASRLQSRRHTQQGLAEDDGGKGFLGR
jgi:hypothetical protein